MLIIRNQEAIKTITVDIFDTVLMRIVYPEDRQFLIHADRAVKIIENFLNISIDKFFFYDLRKYFRQNIDNYKQKQKYDREANIVEIFTAIIDFLKSKYSIEDNNLSINVNEQIISLLIKEEIDIEKQYLKVNYEIVDYLRKCKDKNLQIYFISDMYLSSNDIKELLTHFQIIDIFSGGICSSDVGYGKGTGRLYTYIKQNNLIPDWDFTQNMHIGDNYISDYLMPKKFGIKSYHYQSPHHYFYRNAISTFGKVLFNLQKEKHQRKVNKNINALLEQKMLVMSDTNKELYKIGITIAPAVIYFLYMVDFYASLSKNPVYFTSGEGETFINFSKILGFKSKYFSLKSFNRINLLRAYAYLTLKYDFLSSEAVFKYFFLAEGVNNILEWLDSIGLSAKDLQITKLAAHTIRFDDFLLDVIDLLKSDNQLKLSLEKSYEVVTQQIKEMGLIENEQIIFSDIGWNGTIQILLEQILQVLNIDTSIEGLYLGITGKNVFGLERSVNIQGIVFDKSQDASIFEKVIIEEIWEFVLNSKEQDNDKLITVQSAIADYLLIYKHNIPYSPDKLFKLSINPLIKLFVNPSKEQVILLGSIKHDAGFGSSLVRQVVDFNHTTLEIYKMLLFNRNRFKEIYFNQYWQQGFIVWYNLHILRLFKKFRL